MVNKITVRGIETALVDAGDGPPVVLLHGMAATGDIWAYTLGDLQSEYRVIVPDLPGHGLSGGARRPYSLALFVEWLDGLLDALTPEPVILAGNSLGGAISLAYALAHPERIAALVLVDPLLASARLHWMLPLLVLPRLPHALLAAITRRADPHYFRFVRRRTFYDPWGPPSALLTRIVEKNWARGAQVLVPGLDVLLREYLPRRAREGFVQRLGSISAPTLLVWGRHDGLIPINQAEDAAARIPHADLHILELCCHSPMAETPGQFHAVLRGFLRANGEH